MDSKDDVYMTFTREQWDTYTENGHALRRAYRVHAALLGGVLGFMLATWLPDLIRIVRGCMLR